jgi:hypothetical protein
MREPWVTCRRSDLLYRKSSALWPERDEAVEQRALYRQCNRSRLLGAGRLARYHPVMSDDQPTGDRWLTYTNPRKADL